MINGFVDKIIDHAPEKVDGDRTQEVEIYLKYIGRFEAPMPELTPEEEKRQASLRRHHIKSRERYQMIQGRRTRRRPAVQADPQMLRNRICVQENKHPVLRSELPHKILPAGGRSRQEPRMYLRKLRYGLYRDEEECQILL